MSARITVQMDKVDEEILHLYIRNPRFGFHTLLASIHVDHLKDLLRADDAAQLKHMLPEDYRDFDVTMELTFDNEEVVT